MAPQAAASLKVTAGDLLLHGIVDEIIPEPEGGAHENWEMAAEIIGGYLERSLAESEKMSVKERLEKRYRKFRKMGAFERV